MPSKTFEDLIVWKKAHQWVLEIYHFTNSFPGREQFGLTSQLRRAAISIPANIAEGFKRKGNPDKAPFLQYCSRFYRGMSLLPDPSQGSRLWRYKHARRESGRDKSASRSIC